MPLSRIIEQPLLGFAWILAILVSIGVHEFSHAMASTRLGDSTARDAGRLTLNPLAHVDLLGFAMLLLVGFGWGNPVPFDPAALRARRWGSALVALAGPLANLLACIGVGFALVSIDRHTVLPSNNLLVLFLAFCFQINVMLLLFNLIPIPPLDGSKLLFAALDHPRYDAFTSALRAHGPILLIALVVIDQLTGGAILGRYLTAGMRLAVGFF